MKDEFTFVAGWADDLRDGSFIARRKKKEPKMEEISSETDPRDLFRILKGHNEQKKQLTTKTLEEAEEVNVYVVRRLVRAEIASGPFNSSISEQIFFIGTNVDTGEEKHFGPLHPMESVFIAERIPESLEDE